VLQDLLPVGYCPTAHVWPILWPREQQLSVIGCQVHFLRPLVFTFAPALPLAFSLALHDVSHKNHRRPRPLLFSASLAFSALVVQRPAAASQHKFAKHLRSERVTRGCSCFPREAYLEQLHCETVRVFACSAARGRLIRVGAFCST